jgi:Family of unknown function (DUF5994)
MASCWLVGSGSGPGPRRRSGGDRDPARQRQYGGHSGGGAAGIRAAIPAGPPSPQVSFDDARDRHGAADGRWWPQSRNALTELPGLIAALDSRPGVTVQRLSIHRDDWDDIPHRLTARWGPCHPGRLVHHHSPPHGRRDQGRQRSWRSIRGITTATGRTRRAASCRRNASPANSSISPPGSSCGRPSAA